MLSLYSHAYQSYIWNRVISERARLFGNDKPLVGDIVLVENSKSSGKKSMNNAGRRNPFDVSYFYEKMNYMMWNFVSYVKYTTCYWN